MAGWTPALGRVEGRGSRFGAESSGLALLPAIPAVTQSW